MRWHWGELGSETRVRDLASHCFPEFLFFDPERIGSEQMRPVTDPGRDDEVASIEVGNVSAEEGMDNEGSSTIYLCSSYPVHGPIFIS
jgi:hypothetical protein